MAAETTSNRPGFWRSLWNRKWLVIVPVAVSTVVTLAITKSLPDRYRSGGTILVQPQQVPTDYVRATLTTDLNDRLRSIQTQIMSRTRLERIIDEYNLYTQARGHGLMEDVVEQMRDKIEITASKPDTFTVSFTYNDPRTAQRVADRLATLFIEENSQERRRLSEGTNNFLESTVEETRRKLIAYEQKISSGKDKSRVTVVEFEALQETYKSLLLKQADAAIATNMERRQIGETFRLIDPARLPEQPVGPRHAVVNTLGVLSGVLVGFVLVAASGRREKSA